MAGVVCAVLSPCSDWVLPFTLFRPSLVVLSYSLSYCPVLPLCLLSQHCWLCCVFVAGLCHCGIGVASTVYCPLLTLCVLWCVCCLVVLWCGLWNGGVWAWVCRSLRLSSLSPSLSLSLPPLSLLLMVFGVVRAQPCEHARYPRTPLCLSCCLLFSLSSSSSCPAFPVIVEWRRVFTMCRSVALA